MREYELTFIIAPSVDSEAIPGVIEFTGQSDKTVEIGGFGGNGVYWHGGLEATMYFGDFTPPKNAKKGKKGGKNKKGKNGRR